MTNRATLKTYFAAGSLPMQKHFEDLIESTLNMQDEGFRRTPENGVEISKLRDREAFITLYDSPDTDKPIWSMSADGEGQLLFRPGPAAAAAGSEPVLALRAEASSEAPTGAEVPPRARVGINTGAPQHELDVAGTVRMQTRLGGWVPKKFRTPQGTQTADGVKAAREILADGIWHDITGPLHGCQAFEVMAGTGNKETGRYGLVHAVALNTFHPRRWPLDLLWPKRPIRATTAYYDRRCDMLQLRWFNADGKYGRYAEYCLQVRSKCPYPVLPSGKPPPIRCHITQLWTDELMQDLFV
jgi:hypothetical protein